MPKMNGLAKHILEASIKNQLKVLTTEKSQKMAAKMYKEYVSEDDMSALPHFIHEMDQLLTKFGAEPADDKEAEDEEENQDQAGDQGKDEAKDNGYGDIQPNDQGGKEESSIQVLAALLPTLAEEELAIFGLGDDPYKKEHKKAMGVLHKHLKKNGFKIRRDGMGKVSYHKMHQGTMHSVYMDNKKGTVRHVQRHPYQKAHQILNHLHSAGVLHSNRAPRPLHNPDATFKQKQPKPQAAKPAGVAPKPQAAPAKPAGVAPKPASNTNNQPHPFPEAASAKVNPDKIDVHFSNYPEEVQDTFGKLESIGFNYVNMDSVPTYILQLANDHTIVVNAQGGEIVVVVFDSNGDQLNEPALFEDADPTKVVDYCERLASRAEDLADGKEPSDEEK